MHLENIKGGWVRWLAKPRAPGAPGHHREQYVCLYGYGGGAHQRNPASICIYTNQKEQAPLRWAVRRALTRWTEASRKLWARDLSEVAANHDAWHLQPRVDWARLFRWWSIWAKKEEPKEVDQRPCWWNEPKPPQQSSCWRRFRLGRRRCWYV